MRFAKPFAAPIFVFCGLRRLQIFRLDFALYVFGPIAQSVEQRTFNPWVDGSSPSGPTFSGLQVR
jgi:hypothetical protein